MKRFLTVLVSALAAIPALQAAPSLGITLDKDKIKLDIPDSIVGRSVMVNTIVVSSTSPYVPLHRDISACKVYTLSRVDSTLVLLGGYDNYYVADAEGSLTKALEKAKAGTVEYVFKIDSHKDSVYNIDVTKLFDVNSKNVVNLKGASYSEYDISGFTYSKEKSKLIGVENSRSGVAVRRELTYELNLKNRGLVFELSGKYPATFEAVTTLTVLEPNTMSHKLADKRVGTLVVPVSNVASDRGFKDDNWLLRWDVEGGKNINIYLDTLLAPWQRRSVREGFEEWNRAFEKAGLDSRIVVQDFPENDFNPDDPLTSIVTLSGVDASVSAAFQVDGIDRILAARFFIPSNYINSVRRRSVYTISKVDPRFRGYDIPEDAVAEVMKADFLRVAGLVLGIRPNYAGTSVYSPEQLRNPEFVAANGFTASVTDNVLFNYLAREGDRERGLKTIVDRIGAYDEYAIGFIYGNTEPDDAPQHFYAPANNQFSDYRARPYDLSNDSEADFAAGLEELKFVSENGASWIRDEDAVEESYRILFLDWLWLRGNNLLFLLTSNVGGYRYNSLREGSELPKYQALDVDLQRRSLHSAFKYMRDFAWLDSSELVKIAGANANVSDFSRQNAFNMVNASFRFRHVAFARENAGSEYTVQQYMKDVEDEVFANIGKGKMPKGEMFIVGQYIGWLASNVTLSPNDSVPGMSEISYEYLLRSRRKLKACRHRFSDRDDRLTIDYLLSAVDKKIENI